MSIEIVVEFWQGLKPDFRNRLKFRPESIRNSLFKAIHVINVFTRELIYNSVQLYWFVPVPFSKYGLNGFFLALMEIVR